MYTDQKERKLSFFEDDFFVENLKESTTTKSLEPTDVFNKVTDYKMNV